MIESSDYYGILGVDKDATNEEIKRAYRALAQALHPDKQRSPELREQATQLFAMLSQAHEVLTDPRKREIYDAIGAEGLAAGVDIVPYDGDFQRRWEEIKAARARAAGSDAELKSTTTVQLDARPLIRFLRTNRQRGPLFAATARGGSISTSLRTQLTPTLVVGGQGQLVTRRGVVQAGPGQMALLDVGQGAFTTTVDWQQSQDNHFQMALTMGSDGPVAALWMSRNVTESDQVAIQVQQQLAQGGRGAEAAWVPTLVVHLHRTLTVAPSNNAALLSWAVGPESGLSLTLTHKRPGRPNVPARSATVKLDMGVGSASVAVAASRATKWGSYGGRMKLGLGSMPEGEVSVTRRLGAGRSVTTAVAWQSTAVVGKTAYTHQGHRFEAPVVWHGSPWESGVVEVATASLMAASGPLLTLAGYYLVYRPILALSKRMKGGVKGEEKEVAEMARAKVHAVSLLIRRLAEERACQNMSFGGLVVLRARYGVLSEPSLVLDVTHALQWHCVRRGEAETSLHTEGSKATMWGFADPSPGRFGREKQLQVLYMYGSEPHLATVADSEALVLPEVLLPIGFFTYWSQESHRVDPSSAHYSEAMELYSCLAREGARSYPG